MIQAADVPWLPFAIALAIGALVGIEREQKKRAGESGSGLRTFVLIAEAGAIAAWLSRTLETPWIFAGAGAMVAAVVVAGYWVESRAHPEALGKTTEIAALVVYLLGGAVVFGHAEPAVALAIATSALLAFKEPLHGVVDRIGREDLQAALKLLIATFIVLPVLPNRPVDPFDAINPYKLWWLVILISGLSFAGYVASRWLGEKGGLALTALAGGLVSSTATTLSFARASRETKAGTTPDALAGGVLLAWTVMFARIAVLVAVVERSLLAPLGVPLAAMGLATAALAARHLLRGRHGARVGKQVVLKNPFSLSASIRFALLFAAVLLVVAIVRKYWPGAGLYGVAALAGLTDVDAITLSMADHAKGGGDVRVAAGSIVVAAMANTVVKCGLVSALGSKELRARVWIAGGAILAIGTGAWLLAPAIAP